MFSLPRTRGETVVIVSTSDLTFVKNLSKGYKKELASHLSQIMFKSGTTFSLVFFGRGDILAPGSPSQERDTWKEKVEVMELGSTNLLKELVVLHEEVKVINSLKEDEYMQDLPSILAAS